MKKLHLYLWSIQLMIILVITVTGLWFLRTQTEIKKVQSEIRKLRTTILVRDKMIAKHVADSLAKQRIADSLSNVESNTFSSMESIRAYVIDKEGKAYYDSMYNAVIEKYYGDVPDSLLNTVIKDLK